ncbi:1-aminocyclopropane-1-carboxylate synthase-like protein 1 [Trichoplax sp. H2]|uniref:Aminotransferase class I/classII large domain-containing protein n=1 Tax=Trichoplax adhaerens TaxID=10228 RepID=B3S5P5_TRIAD|nr:hypothetical protein TRIADDRAFT_64185 [Trichoplax adhaerens]EDV21831.1 hypothetical protein TRIADDRAFT_64185 [Trichoplax adhaerens]RDD37063.1 1-aminocyclopropane-1-carboxylate synthase-like protein 1 [Trichoplax sp. H2]|eukprot:XP_002115468.1 hypothetical protein TRIADDRAFT_64185 [Trichoplax adhaerens]
MSSTHSNEKQNCLSKRGNNIVTFKDDVILEAYMLWLKNPYDPESNPQGIINMNISENKTVGDILLPKLNEGIEITEEMLYYGDLTGRDYFRQAMADFLTKYFKASPRPVRKEELIGLCGASSIISIMGNAICDPEEYLLVPSPYYGTFASDLLFMSEARLVPVNLTSEIKEPNFEPFQLTVPALERALQQAVSQGKRVKGFLFSNPANPSGSYFSKQMIKDYLDFAHRHELHIIFDEIYYLSNHAPDADIISVLSMINELPDPERTHFIWAFSKDFASSGLRAGILWTQNSMLRAAVGACSRFSGISPPTQKQLTNMITDYDWLDNVYFPTMRRRLKESYEIVRQTLDELGIRYVIPKAGLFVWVDLIEFMPSVDLEGERKLWLSILENGVGTAPGYAFYCCERGWYRIIFALPVADVTLAMERFKNYLLKIRNLENRKLSVQERISTQ